MGKVARKVEAPASKKSMTDSKVMHPAVAVFLRGRGGKKAQPAAQDYTLGENAIANRKKEFA